MCLWLMALCQLFSKRQCLPNEPAIGTNVGDVCIQGLRRGVCMTSRAVVLILAAWAAMVLVFVSLIC
jgi:hypothetical protein